MQFRVKQISPPKNWGTFEDLCHALFKHMWSDPLAQKNGRNGQAQHGVDVFGSSNGDRKSYRGVQCKGKESNYGSKAEWSEVLNEVARADGFSPKLESWIFATTAPTDATLQKAAREISVERRSKGLFSVDVLGWEEIQALMANAPEVIAEFYPEYADHLPQVIDAKRAVRSIATALRANIPETLKAVRLADDQVGQRMMDLDLAERIDNAENTADRPWQFCFILGGGWRRSKQAADTTRAVGADLILAAVAMRQMMSRDARAVPGEISEICERAQIDSKTADSALKWLNKQRLLVGVEDCRTPHQRFASVVLQRILEGQDKAGRKKIATMIESLLGDPQFPHAGLRFLLHELRFGSGDYKWTRLLSQSGVEKAAARCWGAEGSDRGFAALALADLWDFAEGGARAIVEPHVSVLGNWISTPLNGAYGFGGILNSLAQQDRNVAESVVRAADPIAIAAAYSNADPDSAYGLSKLLRSIAYVRVEDFNIKFLAALDQGKLRQLAKHKAFVEHPHVFSELCTSVVSWDENLAMEMAELFVPTAQQVLSKDAVEGFHQLSQDFAMIVLRVFDPLNVFVGKLKATSRQWAVARRMCERLDPRRVAVHIAAVRPRYFQDAGHFLNFLGRSAPRKFEAVLRELDWEKLDSVIGNDWENMPHETEVLLGNLFSRPATRHLVQRFISERADRIVHFSPRLMLMVPEIGLAHIARGGSLRLAQYNHVSWDFGGFALAVIAEARPELVEQAVAPFVETIARNVTNYHRDLTGPAECFIRVVIEHAPLVWREVLNKFEPGLAEESLSECLKGDEDHRRTGAAVIESAVTLDDPVGEVARRLRARFPKASLAPTDTPPFARRRGR